MTLFGHAYRQSLFCGTLLTFWCASLSAQDAAIGYIKSTEGIVTVTRGQISYQASVGGAVYQGDTLRTFWNGRLGVTFKDDTRISLGPSSSVIIPQFIFSPSEKRYGFVLRLFFGTLQYLSGLTAKLAPDAMKIETPTATIGVRGTRFLARAEPY